MNKETCDHPEGCPMDDHIHPDVFNGAMTSIYRELGEIKALLEKREDSREKDIEKSAKLETTVAGLVERQAGFSRVVSGLMVSVGALVIWRMFEILGRR